MQLECICSFNNIIILAPVATIFDLSERFQCAESNRAKYVTLLVLAWKSSIETVCYLRSWSEL